MDPYQQIWFLDMQPIIGICAEIRDLIVNYKPTSSAMLLCKLHRVVVRG